MTVPDLFLALMLFYEKYLEMLRGAQARLENPGSRGRKELFADAALITGVIMPVMSLQVEGREVRLDLRAFINDIQAHRYAAIAEKLSKLLKGGEP